MSTDLLQLDEWMQAFISRMDGSSRQKLAGQVARELRKLQGQNIKGQRSADGAPWAPRKKPKALAAPIRYVYRGKDGRVREVELANWRDNGGSLTGYDKEAGGKRTLLKVGMLRSLPARNGPTAAATRRAQLMLQRMATPAIMRAKATPEGAEVDFSARAGRIAAVHHFGQRDSVRPGGPEVDYPARALLGIGPKERDTVLNFVYQHFSS